MRRLAWAGTLGPTLLLCTATMVRAAPGAADAVAARAEAVDRCFADKLGRYAAANPTKAVRYTGLTAVYVAEQIVRDAKLDEKTQKADGPLLAMSVEAYCEDVLFKPYIRKLDEALDERSKSGSAGLAPFGTEDIEASSPFVQGYQDLIGRHYKGHSDITRTAIQRFAAAGRAWSPDAVVLVARASQTPDLYRWNDGRYHAHTPEFAPGSSEARRRSTAAGMASFEKLTCDLSSVFLEEAGVGAIEESLFLLGVLAHAVQDLEYHRGMTMSQHSGLSYVASSNPDSPDIARAGEIEGLAVDSTVWLFRLLRDKLGDSRWSLLSSWKPLGDFSFGALASRVYGFKGAPNTQDMKVSALAGYWSLSLAYRNGERPRSELDMDSCDRDGGITCWNTVEVRKRIESRIGSGSGCQ